MNPVMNLWCKRATIVVLLILIVTLGASTVYRASISPKERTDFTVYRAAGQAVLAGTNIYEAHNTRGWLFMSLPAFAVAMVPFAWINVFWGSLLWYLLSVGMIGHAVHLSVKMARRLFPGCPLEDFWLYVLSLLLVLPQTMSGITRGQPSLLVAYLVTLGAWCYLQKREWIAGACLAASIVVKVFPALMLAYFVWKRRWLMALAMAVWLALLILVVPSMVFGVRGNQSLLCQWLTLVAERVSTTGAAKDERYQQTFDPHLKRNQSLQAVVIRWFVSDETDAEGANGRLLIARRVAAVLNGVVLVVLIWTCRRSVRERDFGRALLQLCAVIPAMLFLSPIAWNHYYTAIILPVTVGIAAACEKNGTVSRAFLVGLALYFIGSVLGLTVPALQVRGILFLGTLALWTVFCIASVSDSATIRTTLGGESDL
jgi:hypothetical protein